MIKREEVVKVPLLLRDTLERRCLRYIRNLNRPQRTLPARTGSALRQLYLERPYKATHAALHSLGPLLSTCRSLDRALSVVCLHFVEEPKPPGLAGQQVTRIMADPSDLLR